MSEYSIGVDLGGTNLRAAAIDAQGKMLAKIAGSTDHKAGRDEIEKQLGAKVILENDANAAALGEKWMGAGRDVDDLGLLTLGTGIGGGIIPGGRVLPGIVG